MIRVICDVCGTSRSYSAGGVRDEVQACVESCSDTCRSCAELEQAGRRYAEVRAAEAGRTAFAEYIAKARAEGKVRQANTPEPAEAAVVEAQAEPPA